MKIRGLTLENVRKFAGQRAEISDIGDGISVISEANEFGKSTFFDALHALMFTKHSATGREVQALRPAAGGAVRVAARIETAEGLFTVEKSFLSQKSAAVRDASGRPIAQQDEAERWIAQVMESGLEGPAGLLWVRQGVTAMEPLDASPKERSQLLGVRRDLLSSVAGEIDMVTGGRRMDRVIRAAQDALAALATQTGRPKAGGAWAAAQDEAEALEQTASKLRSEVATLRHALDRRAQVARQLAVLADPEADADRRRALAAAQAADAAARAHAERLATARTEVSLKTLERDRARQALDTLIAREETLKTSEQTFDEATGALAGAEQTLAAAQARYDGLAARRDAATARTAAVRAAFQKAQDAQLRAGAVVQLEAAVKARDAARAQRDRAEQTRARLSSMHVTPKVLRQIEEAEEALRRAQADDATGVTITLAYSGATRLARAGTPLPEGPHRITERQSIDMPGIGTLTLDPGAAALRDDPTGAAERALQDALDGAGQPDAASARTAARAREDLVREEALARQMFETLAPEGLDPLEAAVADAQARLERLQATDADAEAPAQTAQDLEAAERAEQAARGEADEAREGLDHARTAFARAQARAETAQAARDKAQADFGTRQDHETARQDAARALALAEAELGEAQAAVATLEREAPDFDTVAAALARAEGAVAQADSDIQRLRTDLGALAAEIRTRAEDGVEEALAEAEGRHSAAAARAERFAAEVAALRLLIDTLQQTRGAAQDAYFGPIQQELKPLLAILHADAALSFDPGTLLPAQMTRDGTEETLERLSGGTQEQIAVLTRLAFARLFARAGKPMPVILDDALVYSDDDRIERMFTALHRVAQDQQVIVFTCRQRAFGGLGGTRPTVTIGPIA
ncbi:AAA family ATPase [Sulfitobacter sp. HNIBRBA3233]|uniref:AAA family ATPase n=1 Tax=Sulfitobacter marinivivus TaxID=3158558 RepID=UPI0032DF9D1E